MNRDQFLSKLSFEFQVNPSVAILGPRQVGKTTAAKKYIAIFDHFSPQNYFDMENANDIARLQDPYLTLSALSGLIVIDEIQLRRDLFPTLRVLIDDDNLEQQYLILGSASGELMQQASESLAGRISYVELTPFTIAETQNSENLWSRGGFPRAYLALSDEHSLAWRKAFIKTFLEQDIPKLGIKIPAENLRRFWMMLAHYHGCIFNAAEIAGSLGLTGKTIRHYADILTHTFMIRQLQPWYENIAKRQVKSPKIYIRDSGIFHALLGINNKENLLAHPKLGASWEGFALEEIIRHHRAESSDCYFWATQQGAEIDLLIMKNGKKLGFEFKYSSAPKLTKSMRIANQDLKLDSLTVIYPGATQYPLADGIGVVGLVEYISRKNPA